MQLLQMFHDLIGYSHLVRVCKQARNLILMAICVGALGSLSACGQSYDESRSTRRAISQSQAVASDFLRTELALSPETASRLGLERFLGPTANFALNNHSQAGFERRRLVRIELLQRLQNRPILPDEHPLSRDLEVAERALVDLISLEQLGYGRYDYAQLRPYAIDPYSGIWIEGPTLLAYRQSITNTDQATAYLSRLRALSAAVQDTKRRLIADQASGILLPRALVEETQIRLTRLLDEEHRALFQLIETFDALIASVPDLPAARREQLSRLVRMEVTETLIPAYRDLSNTLDGTTTSAADQAGIWAQPRGLDVFSGVLTASLGEPFNTERLHENHLELAAARLEQLSQRMTLDPETNPALAPKPERLSRQYEWFEAAMFVPVPPALGPADTLPVQDIILLLSPKSDWMRIANAGGIDARTDAIADFLIMLEAIPYSLWRSNGAGTRAPYREILEYPAIQSAWQLYVWERSIENAGSDTALLDAVARDFIPLIHSVLAAADTGIHLDRWTIAEATDYVAVHSGLDEPLARQLTLSIAARPGYHSAVAIARQRIEALSQRAQAVLGEQYSEMDFQRTVIEPGPRPLSLLEKDIEAWYGQRLTSGSTN
ncbi:MAG: DUF885 family protein [Pseudomonadota bacterium]